MHFTFFTEEPVFFIAQGRKDCPAMGGAFIKDQEMCKAACTEFAYPQKEILGGFKCYKDHRGYCLQNGKNGGGASMLCEQIY